METPLRSDDPSLDIIREAIEGLIPGATPAFLGLQLTEKYPARTAVRTWTGPPAAAAERIHTALFGRPRSEEETEWMPSARWYPLRPGDLVHIHYEAGLAGVPDAFGETYIVGDAGGPGDPVPRLLSMVLLAHTLPDSTPEDDVKNLTGCYEAEASDDPLHNPWFEAKPHRLTIVRDGRVVHNGSAR
jgi:hypothetical protein